MNSLLASKHNQRGATLLVGLILLLLLTVLALTSARTATLQQRMSGNMGKQNLAFQAAESGIAAATFRLDSDSTEWPSNIGDTRWLCSDSASRVAAWSNTSTCASTAAADEYGYKVAVERVQCAYERPDYCFNIVSEGVHQESQETKATHILGYSYPVLCELTEEMDC